MFNINQNQNTFLRPYVCVSSLYKILFNVNVSFCSRNRFFTFFLSLIFFFFKSTFLNYLYSLTSDFNIFFYCEFYDSIFQSVTKTEL